LSNIVQGDVGTLFEATVFENGSIVNLSTASSVEVVIKLRAKRITKQCTITDAVNGKVQFTLDGADTQEDGNYSYQMTVTFASGSVFSSGIGRFTVDKKL
jgi:hypothetical protein